MYTHTISNHRKHIKENYSKLKPLIDLLPKKEQDLIYAFCVLNKSQRELAVMFRLTQGGISHRLCRALQRLDYIVNVPKFNKSELIKDLKCIFQNKETLDILWCLYETTCQSEAAKKFNMTQSRIRHRLTLCFKTLEKIKEIKPFDMYYKTFSMLYASKFNILHEIRLPKWEKKNENYTAFVNKDNLNKLTDNINTTDKVLITEGAYRNLSAKVLQVYYNSKTADLLIQLNSLKIKIPNIPFNWFTKRNSIQQENAAYLVKKHKNMNINKLTSHLDTKDVKSCLKFLETNNLAQIKQGKKHTRVLSNF